MLTGPPLGGPNTFLLDLAARLAGRGWLVTVLGGSGMAPGIREQLTVAGVAVNNSLLTADATPDDSAARIRWWVTTGGQDVFVVSNCRAASWLALPGLPATVRTVSVAHHDVTAYTEPAGYYCRFLDAVVGVSGPVTDRLRAVCGPYADRCRYIPYGVRPLRADWLERKLGRPHTRPLNLGFVGRVADAQKRVMHLPELMDRLHADGVAFTFDVVGDGPDRRRLEAEVGRRGHGGRCTFYGWQSGADLGRRFEELDVFVLLSNAEGLPIAMLEAMAHGCVPLVSDIDSGMRQVIADGVNGFLVPFDDLTAQGWVVSRLANDPPMLARLQRAAWATGQGYTAERMADAYDSLFHELLASPRRPAAATDFPPMPSCRSRYPRWLRRIKHRLLRPA